MGPHPPPQWRKLYHVLRQGRRPRPDWFVYKEPFISLAPRYVLEAIPEAKIIYIYRDGRDVANSLVETYDVLTNAELKNLQSAEMRMGRPYDDRYVPWWVQEERDEEFIQSPPYVRAIWMWAYMAQRCREYFSGLDASVRSAQVLEIQYETFTQVPHETGERICEHLDTDRTRAFDRHLDAARTSSIGKHEQRPEAERQAAEDLAGSVLTTLGYPLTASLNSRAQRTDA
ncbi:sulfotransferase [Salinibacter ruber]|uniref:sulfotransferase n=1 Tax=Salinibacter ruber TaxID=146919 RepID=UPI00216779CE|nr:sulfotransferase [Salinibacter ruber]